MKGRHLRLVNSTCTKNDINTVETSFYEKVHNYFECIFTSKNEKIYMIKDVLTKIYRDYELTTGFVDVPYFVRAESRMTQIIKEKKIDYYYNKLKKFQNKKFLS